MNPSISDTRIRANEALTLRLELSERYLKLIRNPEVRFPDNFETYDPPSTTRSTWRQRAHRDTNHRVHGYPQVRGQYTIPPVEFTFFDLNSRTYKTLTSPNIGWR